MLPRSDERYRDRSRNGRIVSACSIVGFAAGLVASEVLVGDMFVLFGCAGAVVGFLVGIGVTCWLTAGTTRRKENNEEPDERTP